MSVLQICCNWTTLQYICLIVVWTVSSRLNVQHIVEKSETKKNNSINNNWRAVLRCFSRPEAHNKMYIYIWTSFYIIRYIVNMICSAYVFFIMLTRLGDLSKSVLLANQLTIGLSHWIRNEYIYKVIFDPHIVFDFSTTLSQNVCY